MARGTRGSVKITATCQGFVADVVGSLAILRESSIHPAGCPWIASVNITSTKHVSCPKDIGIG